MSGYKRATVSISQDEYDRLREAENNLRALPEVNRDAASEIEGQSYQLLQSNIQDINNRQEQFTHLLSNVDQSITSLEASTNTRLQALQLQTAAQIEQSVGQLWKTHEVILQNQTNQFLGMFQTWQAEQRNEIALLSNNYAQWRHDLEARQIFAENWLFANEQLLSFIREQYAHNFFFPGKLQRYELQLAQAYQNYENGLFDAVVSVTQNAYLDLSELHLELEYKQTEWHLVYQAAWEAVNIAYAKVVGCDYVAAYDLEGNELPYLVDVNYWTQDQITCLETRVNSLGQQLLNEDALPGLDILKNMLDEQIPTILNTLEEVVLDARIKTINSQLRINVADLVIQALQQQGFSLNDSAYQSNDLRLSYGAQLRNIEGNEVVVSVSPKGDLPGENELQITSFDAEVKTEHELIRRWQEIHNSLKQYGVEVGQMEQINQTKTGQQKQSNPFSNQKPVRLPMKAVKTNGN